MGPMRVGARREYETIGDAERQPSVHAAYGSLYQASVQGPTQDDLENPFSVDNVMITHRGPSPHLGGARRRLKWWAMVPAVALLVMAGLAIGVHREGRSKGVAIAPSAAAPQGPEILDTPALDDAVDTADEAQVADAAAVEESKTQKEVANKPMETVLVWGKNKAREANDKVKPQEPQPPAPNATVVFSCLESKCDPLLKQLGQAWRDIANINLLRCLANSAFNKTQASQCFKSAGPSELRDDLVACAGCNHCITLSDQASIDKACAKYDAWAQKQKAPTSTSVAALVHHADQPKAEERKEGPASREEAKSSPAWSFDVEHPPMSMPMPMANDNVLGSWRKEREQRPPQQEQEPAKEEKGKQIEQPQEREGATPPHTETDAALLHNLPAHLWGRYCSRWWCA